METVDSPKTFESEMDVVRDTGLRTGVDNRCARV